MYSNYTQIFELHLKSLPTTIVMECLLLFKNFDYRPKSYSGWRDLKLRYLIRVAVGYANEQAQLQSNNVIKVTFHTDDESRPTECTSLCMHYRRTGNAFSLLSREKPLPQNQWQWQQSEQIDRSKEVAYTMSIPTFLPSFEYCYYPKESKGQNLWVLHSYPAIFIDFGKWNPLKGPCQRKSLFNLTVRHWY